MIFKRKYLICKCLTCIIASLALLFASQKSSAQAQSKIDSLFNLITPEISDSVRARYYYEIAYLYNSNDSSIKYFLKSLDYCDDTNAELLVKNYYHLAAYYYITDESEKAFDYLQLSEKISKENDFKLWLARTYSMIGNCYEDFNDIDSALYYTNKALETVVLQNDTSEMTATYCNLGRINTNIGFYESAEDYFFTAYFLDSVAGNLLDLANDCQYIGGLYASIGDSCIYKSRNYMCRAVHLFDSIPTDNTYYIAARYNSYSGLAEIYIDLAKQTGVEAYADSCLICLVEVGNYYLQQCEYSNYIQHNLVYSDYYIFYERYNEALNLLHECEKYLSNTYIISDKCIVYEQLSYLYQKLGDYKNAYQAKVKQIGYERQHLNDSTLTAVANSKVEQAMMIQKMEQKRISELHQAEKRKMRIVIFSLISGLALVAILVFVVLQMFRVKRRSAIELANKNSILAEQKEEIESQKDRLAEQNSQLEQQKNEIEKQRDVIQSSINYANRIQNALLVPESAISEIFPDHFLMHKPRDIVSGDYYWVSQFGDYKVCVVGDCTGHGVPGGFMSMLGITNLNYIVGQELSPEAILNTLRDAVIISLRQQSDTENESIDDNIARSRDGMDVAIYVINYTDMKLSFAGANIPLVLIRDGEMNVLKPNKMPVGIYARMEPFERIDIDLRKGDCLYTFTDGFQDQYGFETEQKFMSKRLRELLLEIHQRPMAEQLDVLNRTFEDWRGPADNQTDDVLIMGVRV